MQNPIHYHKTLIKYYLGHVFTGNPLSHLHKPLSTYNFIKQKRRYFRNQCKKMQLRPIWLTQKLAEQIRLAKKVASLTRHSIEVN